MKRKMSTLEMQGRRSAAARRRNLTGSKALLVVVSLAAGVQIHLVGQISVAEFFYVLYTAYIVACHREYWRIREYATLTKLYAGLLAAQVVSEFMVGNEMGNTLRGLAVTVMSFCHLTFLVTLFMKDRSLVAWAIAGELLVRIVFPSTFQGDVGESLSGEDATFLKFVVAPTLVNILLFVSVIWRVRVMPVVMIYTGLLFVVCGARSMGLLTFLTGLVLWFFLSGKRISKKKIARYAVIILVGGYGMYALYASAVLSGKITAGNTAQLLHAKDPYNPLNLLMQGRSEMFIGWYAFMDKPLFGHGAWAEDPGLKYHKLYDKVRSDTDEKPFDAANFSGVNVIPTHSVIIGYGMYNGIAAFVIIIAIIYFFLKRGFRLILYSKDRYLVVIAFYFLSICWNSLFSPVSHFRYGLPINFAFILVSYWEYMIRLRKERRAAEERLAAERAEESNGGEEKRRVDAEAREADGTRKCKGDVTGEEQEVAREKEERTDVER